MDFNYYDKQARPIQLKSQNHLSGTDALTQTYSFVGELLSSIRSHVANSVTTTIGTYTDYDHVGRKVATRSVINGQPEVMLSRLFYNELGQLKDQKLHSKDNGTSFLYTSAYSYNERGWLKQMSGTEFSFELKYNDATGGMTAQYNGNIANQVYNNNGSNTFNYEYDKLNRLINGSASGMSEALSYDVMGNIKHLNRNSGGTTLYSYSGNRLNSISGGGLTTGAYGYDGNGNATTDGRTGVTLTYNYLNLPATAIKSGLNLTYTYDAAGNKLRKLNSTTATTTDYVGGIQYTGGVIDFIQTENGIAKDTLGVYRYRYNLTDHLGNVRATIRESVATPGTLQVMQRDNYYAFGLTQVAGARNNKYLYNSKELQTELGQYDYGAGFYDPVIGRWNVVDPLADVYQTLTPYAYVMNNPLKFNDPTGMFSTHTDEEGNVVAIYEDGDLGVYKHKNGTTQKEITETRKSTGTTSGSGEYVGETWTELGFADFEHYEKHGAASDGSVKVGRNARIDFSSNWAFSEVRDILTSKPSSLEYFKRAGGDGDWDIKNNVPKGETPYYGSKLYGKYASARDAGNFAAGAVAQSSPLPNFVFDYGFGLYNASGNNKRKMVVMGLLNLKIGPVFGGAIALYISMKGEDKLSRAGIEAGKNFIRGGR